MTDSPPKESIGKTPSTRINRLNSTRIKKSNKRTSVNHITRITPTSQNIKRNNVV